MQLFCILTQGQKHAKGGTLEEKKIKVFYAPHHSWKFGAIPKTFNFFSSNVPPLHVLAPGSKCKKVAFLVFRDFWTFFSHKILVSTQGTILDHSHNCARVFLRRFWNFDARDFEQFPIKYWNLAFWLINNFPPDKHILISRYLHSAGVRTSRGLGPAGCGDRRGMAIFWGGVWYNTTAEQQQNMNNSRTL